MAISQPSPKPGESGPPDDKPAAHDPLTPDFAPNEPTDGRGRGDWESRYTGKAVTRIRIEAIYVAVAIVGGLAVQLAMVLEFPRPQTGLNVEQWQRISPFIVAYFAGLVGGALFSTKWLYHTVAHGTWNADRVLWRIFTPILSGGAGLTIVLLSAGHVIPLFGAELVRTNAGAAGVAILIGYFSDRTFSALENFAEGQLGSLKQNEPKESDSNTNGA